MDVQTCIDRCEACRRACVTTAEYTLDMEELDEGGPIRALHDCADICLTAANFLLRNSESQRKTCELCAEVCEQCAEECDDLNDDEVLQSCAELCRSCAEGCRQMAA